MAALWEEVMSIKGTDKWGEFQDFTGREAVDHCFWCGVAVHYKRYCCPDHKQLYLEHFSWLEARAACIERNRVGVGGELQPWYYEGVCQDCGEHCIDGEYAIHHIVPLDGEYRAMSWLNRPENLVLLCNECHMTRHKELNHLMRQLAKCENQEPFQRFVMPEQLELVLF